MGTQVHYKSYMPGYHPMRDLNEDSNSSSWPLFYGDKNLSNGQYYTGFMPKTITDAYPGCDKNALKQKMLEHETIFRDQVCELHRVYRIQRDMMEEIKRKDLHRQRASIEPSSSSSFLGSQAPAEDTRKWHVPSYPLMNSGYARSAASGADIVSSPLSCTKGNTTLASRLASQNGCTSKDTEVLEARPSKVRKKLFDLQLPADEYIDPEDHEPWDTKTSGISSLMPNGEHKISSESNMKLSLGGVGERTAGSGDGFTCISQVRNSVSLADLNEPVDFEEPTSPSSIDILGNSAHNGWVKGIDLSAKSNSGLSSVQKEVIQWSHTGSHNGFLNNLSTENKVNGREWFSCKYEAGHGQNNFSAVSKGLQQDKLPFTSAPASMLNQGHSSTLNINDHRKEDLCRRSVGLDLGASDRSHNYSNNNHHQSVLASQMPIPNPLMGSSDVANTWPQFTLPWGKPVDSLTQKLTSFHTHPSLISSSSLSKGLQSPAQCYDVFGDKWNINGGCRLNSGLETDPGMRNGFYLGSSSGSKDLPVHFPPVDFNYLNGSRSGNVASEHLNTHGLEKSLKGSKYVDQKPPKGMNLNVAFLNDSLKEAALQRELEIVDERSKCESHQSVLPWLRAKPASKTEGTNSKRDTDSVGSGFFHASPNSFFGKTENIKDLNQTFTGKSASSNHMIRPKEESSEIHGGKTILGFPIFEKVSAPKNESQLLVSSTTTLHPTLEGENVKHKVKNRVIDINVDASLLESGDEPAVEEMAVEKALNKSTTCARNFIDLNSCVTEDEETPVPSVVSNVHCVKVALEIDLEAPPVPEAEEDILPERENEQETAVKPPDHNMEQAEDEIVKSAAEAILDISLSCQSVNLESIASQPSDASFAESLLWFADIVTFTADEIVNKTGKETEGREGGPKKSAASEGMDDFEAMTLQLPETKEEDYMPKPFVPEVQKVEETGTNSLPTRPRRGQARRGRQRRDFQRDILPGLASLSRHEVTEDLQTFGGLMRATGHPWNSGLTRRNGTRNGGTRGRRRTVVETTSSSASASAAVCTPLVQQLNNTETGLEDRSLTGWGKTPRRPRRQRCPAGNPPTVTLT